MWIIWAAALGFLSRYSLGANSPAKYLWPFDIEEDQLGEDVDHIIYPEQGFVEKDLLIGDDAHLLALPDGVAEALPIDPSWMVILHATENNKSEKTTLGPTDPVAVNEQGSNEEKGAFLKPVEIYRFPRCENINDLIINWGRIKIIAARLVNEYESLDKVPEEQENEVQVGFYLVAPLGHQLDKLGEERFRIRFGGLSWERALGKATSMNST